MIRTPFLRVAPLLAALLPPLLSASAAQAADQPKPAVDPAVLNRIREAAMSSNWAYQRLADLTDHIGPRLSGPPQAELAVNQVATALRGVGLQVTLQPVKVPHWVRGEERAELVEYPGRPAGLSQKLILTALGGSTATPAEGLTAPVLLVHGMDDLQAHAGEAKGRIVVFNTPFDQSLADNGLAGPAYGQGWRGAPSRALLAAAKLGAAACLVRSVGGADYRLPHTGTTLWDDNGPQIPAGALTAEDTMLLERLAAQGPGEHASDPDSGDLAGCPLPECPRRPAGAREAGRGGGGLRPPRFLGFGAGRHGRRCRGDRGHGRRAGAGAGSVCMRGAPSA